MNLGSGQPLICVVTSIQFAWFSSVLLRSHDSPSMNVFRYTLQLWGWISSQLIFLNTFPHMAFVIKGTSKNTCDPIDFTLK